MSQKIIIGVIGAIIGLILGNLTAPGGPDIDALEERLTARIDASAEAGSGLEEQFAGIEERVTGVSEQLSAVTEQVTALTAQVEGIGGSVAANGVALDGVTDSLQSGIADMRATVEEATATQASTLEDMMAGMIASRSAVSDEPATDTAAPEAEEEAEAPAPEGLTAGQTALLEDGGIRVFVSRVTEDAAQLGINGAPTQRIREGRARRVDLDGTPCLLTVDAVDRGHVQLSSACGDALPDPSGATVGTTVLLGDGAARVFVSAVDDAAQSARIAVNGVTAQSVGPDSTVDVGDGCAVTVEGIDRGHVDLSYGCEG